jgi:oxalate decarboxylase
MRELHWHPNTDEWQYYIEGQARMGVFAASGQARTFDFQANDVGYVPCPWISGWRSPRRNWSAHI